MKIEVDQNVCIGAGNCVFNAPAVFDQREKDGIVVLLKPMPGPDQQEAARKAARLCPSRAIRVTEDNP